MMNLLHTFNPDPILISFGHINIYWYGFFIVIGIIFALLFIIKIARYYYISPDLIFDCAFYIILSGIIGARIYDVFLQFSYYSKNPIEIFKIWNGGLAIHGAIIAGIITLFFYAKKKNINFWLLGSLAVPGLALAQAFGRWGNYFNQELYGSPTNLPWGIPIEFKNRLPEYINFEYFHPAFLYESIGNLLIFVLLLVMHYFLKKNKLGSQTIVLSYLIMYSLLRFFMEEIRIDPTINLLGFRLPQLVGLIIILFSTGFMFINMRKSNLAKN